MTGLTEDQLTELVSQVHARTGSRWERPGLKLGLYRSVALVVHLLRENPTQAVAGAIFGISQPTVSRRWDELREVIGQVLAEWTPTPAENARNCTVLVDGTLCLTWDWNHRKDLYSGKHRDHGFNVQVVAATDGRLLGLGAPVGGARHDAHAWTASGIEAKLAGMNVVGDLGYIGLGIVTGHKTPPGRELTEDRQTSNTTLSRIRAHVEHAISRLKNWKIIGGRYRAPLNKFESTLTTVFALHSYKFGGRP